MPFTPSFAPAEQPPSAEVQAAQAAAELEEAGAFEEVTPGETPPIGELGTDIPVLSADLAALSQVASPRSLLGIARDNGWFPSLLPPVVTGEEAFPVPETPETLRESALRQIRINSFDEGVSNAESTGTVIEGIPVVGNRARAWAGGLIEQPSDNVNTVLDEINSIKEDASTGQEKVRNGLEDPEFGLGNARSMEERISQLEGRIKLLIITSPVLQASTDNVNRIFGDIFESKEKVSRYRKASRLGLTAQLTGTGRLVPTDEQMFFELKRFNEGTR